MTAFLIGFVLVFLMLLIGIGWFIPKPLVRATLWGIAVIIVAAILAFAWWYYGGPRPSMPSGLEIPDIPWGKILVGCVALAVVFGIVWGGIILTRRYLNQPAGNAAGALAAAATTSVLAPLAHALRLVFLLATALFAAAMVWANREAFRSLYNSLIPLSDGTVSLPVNVSFVWPWEDPRIQALLRGAETTHVVAPLALLVLVGLSAWIFYRILRWAVAATAGVRSGVVIYAEALIPLLAVAILYAGVATVFPHFTKAVLATIPLWLVVVYTVIFILVMAATKGTPRVVLGSIMVLLAIAMLWQKPPCAPGDTTCHVALRAAEAEVVAQAAAERQRRKENELREEQRARRVARSPTCPGEKAEKAITIPEGVWTMLPSKPGMCDFAISDIPRLEFTHNSSTIDVSADRGQINTSIPTHARAKRGTGTVVADYLLCPRGMGPGDGSWECRAYSPSLGYSVVDAIFGKH